jgi:hypothetical protein
LDKAKPRRRMQHYFVMTGTMISINLKKTPFF